MATESVATIGQNSIENLYCKCQQVAGVLALLAQNELASDEEIKDATWGALELATEARDMARDMVFGLASTPIPNSKAT